MSNLPKLPATGFGVDLSGWQGCWPLRGFAPGSYMCKCHECGEAFMGDKRASECGACAVKGVKALVAKLDEDLRGVSETVKSPPERIAAAAIFHGSTISLPPPARHHTILETMHLTMGIDVKKVGSENQGFLTSHGRFVNRVEAYHIAWKQKQMIRQTGSAPELFSEDLW